MQLKKVTIGVMTCAFLAVGALTASFVLAGMDHSAMAGMEMAKTASGPDILLKDDLQDGVKASAQLKDIKEAMAQQGGTQTHHFMVEFYQEGGGKRLDGGTVAIKIVDPAGNELKPAKMMAMKGSFGADVELSQSGDYLFEVGTRLSDGRKRLFRFHYSK